MPANEKPRSTAIFTRFQTCRAAQSSTAQRLVDKHWDAIQVLAQAVLAKPVTPRPLESFQKWKSSYRYEKWIDGSEIGSLLKTFGLCVILRKESEGIYLSPDIHSGL
jgi:hypothetical protein